MAFMASQRCRPALFIYEQKREVFFSFVVLKHILPLYLYMGHNTARVFSSWTFTLAHFSFLKVFSFSYRW